MFCLCRTPTSSYSIHAVVLDYVDPDSECDFALPPSAQYRIVANALRKMGMLPKFKLIHFPDDQEPRILDGAVWWTGNKFLFSGTKFEAWELDFESCQLQNRSLAVQACQGGYPAKCPMLSTHSEEPMMKIESTSIGNFYDGSAFDGKRMAREWVAGLSVVHHLSTAAILQCLKFPKSRQGKLKLTSKRKDRFMVWWPGPKPINLEYWLRDLYRIKQMPAVTQCELHQVLPHLTGFYRVAITDRHLYIDDQSNVPYEYSAELGNGSASFRNGSRRKRIRLQLPRYLRLSFDVDGSVRTLEQESHEGRMFSLPLDVQNVQKEVGVLRSHAHDYEEEVWNESLRNVTFNSSILPGIVHDSEANSASLLRLCREE